ncbi:MAG: response regulator [Clostridiales bacterium]|nr:response regulator [Clostridiales bacterium]
MNSNDLETFRNYFLNICHDIKTPLNVIIGISSLAKNCLDDPEKINQYLSKIESTSYYLFELVNDLLDLYKIESNKMILREEKFNTYDLINSINTLISPLLQEKQLMYKYEVNVSEENQNIIGDQLKLKQVLLNLLSNSIKYTAIGGNIELSVDQIKIENDSIYLKFRVSDNGIGMSEEFMKKLFEPFSHSEELSHGRNTTGLGLYLTKNLVTILKGSIKIESKPKAGTVVTVNLPFKLTEAKHQTKESHICLDSFNFSNKRILLVEDNEALSNITIEILKKTHADIDYAKDGLEALRLFESSEPGYYDAILMDVKMPVIDGNNATKLIRDSKHRDSKDIVIIGVTGKVLSKDLEESIGAGMNEYITKPIDYTDLFLLLEKYFKAQ